MNRITLAIAKMETQIKERVALGMTTATRVKATGKQLDMSIMEHVKFQELKSLAVSNGKLTVEEGVTVFSLLGNTVSVFNRRSVAVKAVLTGLFQELLSTRIHNGETSCV
ncbi:MAG: hypothetical protein K2R98_19390 [Gemmataceae bacterium]|nr:hypothetical protein [Gemmataceae bacterium]